MTALSICQNAALELSVDIPTALFSSTARTERELRYHLNAVLKEVFKAHDWEHLCAQATFTGDGSTTFFANPSAYDRMKKGARVWYSGIEDFIIYIDDNRYLDLTLPSETIWPPMWRRGTSSGTDGFIIYPAMTSGDTANFWYVKTSIVNDAEGNAQATFAADTDVFMLPDERLLELGVVWKYKKAKGQPYGEALQDYQTYLEQMINEDKGFTTMAVGTPRISRTGARVAYPLNISAS